MSHESASSMNRPSSGRDVGTETSPDNYNASEGAPSSIRTERWVTGVLQDVFGGTQTAVSRLHVLREGAKQLALVELADGRHLALKQYQDDRGQRTLELTQRLTQDGFGPASALGVTPVHGWSSEHRTMINDVAPGLAWSDWLLEPALRRDAAARVAGQWLVKLQSSGLVLPDRTAHRSAADMQSQGQALSRQFPDYAARLGATMDRTLPRLRAATQTPTEQLVVSHGDLHPNNLHISSLDPAVATALDLDTVGLRTPAYDSGYAIAQLLVFSWMHTGSFETGASAAQHFWQQWSAQVNADVELVAAETVRALFQSLHFELVTYDTGRHELLDAWLDLAEAVHAQGIDDTVRSLTPSAEVLS